MELIELLTRILATATVIGLAFAGTAAAVPRLRHLAPFGLIPLGSLVAAFANAWITGVALGSRFGEKGEMLGLFIGFQVGALIGPVATYLLARRFTDVSSNSRLQRTRPASVSAGATISRGPRR